jgi:type I restriction enzyme M protein
MIVDFTKQTKELIDELKKVCADFGLGNDGNESKIITQMFLYKFMNDKFGLAGPHRATPHGPASWRR